MSKADRIKQLSAACWAFRGQFDPTTGKWTRPPEPRARARVERCLSKLRVTDIPGTMTQIETFKTGDEFRAWLKTL